jgi:hypothetical protein
MILLLLLACTGVPKDDTATDLEPTMANVQTEIFTASCAFSSCHGPGSGMDLSEGEAHAAIVGVAAADAPDRTLVVAGDADASYLVEKCTPGASGLVGERMPDGSDGLDATRLALLRAWVDAGAPAE